MSIFDCWKNKFNCSKVYENEYNHLDQLLNENKKILKDINGLKKEITRKDSMIDGKKSCLKEYDNYKKMWNDIPSIEKVGKPITKDEIIDIFKKSWGVSFVGGGYPHKASRGSNWDNPYRNVEVHYVSDMYSYRIPMDIMKKILKRSIIDKWTHMFTWGHPDGAYACNDYATSLWSEIRLAPLGYSNSVFGILGVSGHRINCFIPAEEDKVYYIEPQTDKIWFPDLDKNSNEKKPSHIIF